MNAQYLDEQPVGGKRDWWNHNRAVSCRRGGVLRAVATLTLLFACGQAAWGQYTSLKLPKGYVQVEGDIITTEEKAAQLLADRQGIQTSFVYAPSRLWPNRVVPFVFDPSVTAAQRSIFLAAMGLWTNSFPGVVTISFRPRTTEVAYLSLGVGNPGFEGGLTDFIGCPFIFPVIMTVHPNAVSAGLIAHELGHALGLWHEQGRNDRDAFVTINYSNLQFGTDSQFDKAFPQSTFGTYDYDSIMHYFSTAFSKDSNCGCPDATCETITTFFSAQQCRIGQQNHLSEMDKRSMAFMYGPPDWKFLYAKTGSSGDGSFQQPFLNLAPATTIMPNSTLWIGPGTFPAAGVTISTPMTLRAAIPDLQLQPDGSLGPSPTGYATLQ